MGANLPRYYSAASEAHKSFPSADATEAVVLFGTMAVARGGGTAWLWLLFALIPCFGRVYFHAHYLLDVTAGFCIGTCAVVSVIAYLQIVGRNAAIWDCLPAVGAFLLIKCL